jgi:hypothetical protein
MRLRKTTRASVETTGVSAEIRAERSRIQVQGYTNMLDSPADGGEHLAALTGLTGAFYLRASHRLFCFILPVFQRLRSARKQNMAAGDSVRFWESTIRSVQTMSVHCNSTTLRHNGHCDQLVRLNSPCCHRLDYLHALVDIPNE